MTGLCIFMTLLNVLATPEEIIKIYIQTKKLCHFNHTFIEKKKIRDLPVYKIKKNSDFNRIKIVISLDLTKIY